MGVAASGGIGGVSGQEDAVFGTDARRRYQRQSARWLLLGVRTECSESAR